MQSVGFHEEPRLRVCTHLWAAAAFQRVSKVLESEALYFGLCNSLNTQHFAIKCLFNDRAHRMEHPHFVLEWRSEAADGSSHRKVLDVPLHLNLS